MTKTENIGGFAHSNYDGGGGIDVNGVVDVGVNGIVDVDVDVDVNGVVDIGVDGVVDGDNTEGIGVGVGNDISVVDNDVSDAFCDGVMINPEILARDMLNETPPIGDVDTPNISFSNDSSGTDTSVCDSDADSQSSQIKNSANSILKDIQIKNVNRLIIGTLNINFIAPIFKQLKEVIGSCLDIFTIQETKIDKDFTEDQFEIEGYHKPYRLDRDKHGGGVLIYVREDIPCKLLEKHNFTRNIEGIFIEINLRKTKLVFFGAYRSEKHATVRLVLLTDQRN